MNRFSLPLLALALTTTGLALGATKYVRPGATGSGNGTDWANAYPKLPASLTRGDVYYLAAGQYGAATFDDANSGTTVITLKKATESDHGTSSGWQASYGEGQAVFTSWLITRDYYVFDGQRRNSDWARGAISDYGLRVAGDRPVRLDDGAGVGADHVTFRFVDFEGGGRDTGSGDDVIYGLTGNSDLRFESCALHDSDRTIFLMRGNWQNLVVDHSYLARNTSTPATHGEMLSMTESTNVSWTNNVMEDIEGTAFIAGLNGGVIQGWKVVGNVAFHSAAYAADTGRKSGHNFGVSGFLTIANDASNDNTGNDVFVANNTFVNLQGLWSGVIIQKGTGNEVRNNVWYGCVRTNNSFSGTIDHNWYASTPIDADSSPTKTECTSKCDLFVSIANKDFHLKAATTAGAPLATPFTVDGDGVTRGSDHTWDRGAFEFGGTVASLAPPTNLRVVK